MSGRSRKSHSLLVGLLMVLLSACSSTQIRRATSSSSIVPAALSVLFTSSRMLELEPCGCSFYPVGGINREWNLLRKWRKELPAGSLLTLNAGITFVPERLDPKLAATYSRKAEVMVEALNGLKLDALSPSADDFFLGTKRLKQLEAKAHFPFVSSNLYSKATHQPIFHPYLEIEKKGISILLVGLSAQPTAAPPKAGEIEILPPEEALRKVFAKLGTKKPSLVILLTAMNHEEVQKLELAFPRFNLVLGGSWNATDHDVQQDGATILRIAPLTRGRAIARIDFTFPDPQGPLTQIYNPVAGFGLSRQRDYWQQSLSNVQALMKREKKAKRKRELASEAQRLQALLKLTDGATFPVENGARYQYQVVDLDKTYDEPRNAMNDLLDRYTASLHQRAVQSYEEGGASDGQ